MKYEQVAEIAKIYNQIQMSQDRLQELKDLIDPANSYYLKPQTREEVNTLIKHHTSKIQRLKEVLTNAAIGEL